MQNAKDSFYIALRNRLAVLNPARMMTLRGVQRPGILTEEAEAVSAQIAPDVFVLRWTGLKADLNLPQPLLQLDCEIHYTTSGTQNSAGMDRGRQLEGMDAELLSIVAPFSTAKMDYTQAPPVEVGTTVFWNQPAFGPATTIRDRVERAVKVSIFTYQEQGEQ